MNALRVLDLFSGIGGFAYSLKDVTTTVAYCDIEETSRNVLQKRMERGNIHTGHMFTDVKAITQEDMMKLKPNMITAGFPCQDISVANPCGKGLKGEKSGLFKHILRLIDIYPHIDVVFLENSSHIIDAGYKTIHNSFKKRGYIVKYVLLRASDVGAYHKRLRWYCLCYKPHAIKLCSPIRTQKIKYNWDNYQKYNTVVKYKSKEHKRALITRCGLLGNSIVPQCCMYAWNLLIDPKFKSASIAEPLASPKLLDLTFFDGTKKITKTAWATPAHSIWNIYSHLTERGSRVLSNQSYYYNKMTKHLPEEKPNHYREYVTNPEFVECLMGYPQGWTIP
jgi:site-specific DNA-cytosine methylase